MSDWQEYIQPERARLRVDDAVYVACAVVALPVAYGVVALRQGWSRIRRAFR